MPRLAVAAGASWPWEDHMTEPTSSVSGLPRAATIATMASRVETFQQVLPVIHAQVDHVFVYLDGYDAVPGFLQDFDRISVYRAEEVGDLHCSSRFLCLQHLDTPTVVVSVDDDIIYPPDYVDRLVEALHQAEGLALVGVHGRIFRPPHRSYVHDAAAFQFAQELVKPTHVHELGMGTSAFVSSQFDIDPRQWDRFDMDDIVAAIEAQRRGLPRIAVARPAGWMKVLARRQPDSLWMKAQMDDTEHSRRMRALLGLYA